MTSTEIRLREILSCYNLSETSQDKISKIINDRQDQVSKMFKKKDEHIMELLKPGKISPEVEECINKLRKAIEKQVGP